MQIVENIKGWIIPIIVTLIMGSFVVCCGVRKGKQDLEKKNSMQNEIVRNIE